MVVRRITSQAREFADVVRSAARAYGANPARVAALARRLRAREGFGYAEALRLGVLDPEMSPARRARVVSRHRMVELQRTVNPEALGSLSSQKDYFFRYFSALGLTVAEVYGAVSSNGPGWRRGGGMLDDAADLRELLAEVPDEIVVKPVDGFQGHGVRLLRRDEIDPEALLAELRAEEMFSDWLIQRRLHNHPVVAGITGSATLETLRIATFVERSGEVSVLYADHRLALVEGTVNNLRGGRTRNGVAPVRLEDGVLGKLRRRSLDGIGFDDSATLDDGTPVEGVQLPDWDATLALVRRAGTAMLPARTMGWDVALTPEGPVIIEANMFYWPSTVSDQGSAAARIERA